MLSLGKCQALQQFNAGIIKKPVSKAFLFPARTHQIHVGVSFSPNKNRQTHHHGHFERKKRTGLCIYSSKSQRKGGNSVVEVEDFDEVEDDDDDFFEEEEEEEGFVEEEDDEFIPLSNMKNWLEDKPRGFGEGKVYDTSIEDKLMEEIEQSRSAQLANINNLKNNPGKSNSKGQQGNFAVSEDNKHGFRVRMVNLPKKKNIHRDLASAFKGVPGIVQIVPVVSGNKRTKDPICKGLAFIDFKSENDAYKFVHTFSGQSITFGKVQKQLKFDMNISSNKSGNEYSSEETVYTAQSTMPVSNYLAETDSIKFEIEDDVHELAQVEDDEECLEDNQSLPTPESRYGGDSNKIEEHIMKSSSFKEKRELQEKRRKVPSKPKKVRIQKMNIPGSANRLKIKEKAQLAGVFSKYVTNTSSATEIRTD